MTDEDICQYAEEIRNGKDPFSCWAHNHILISLKEWKDVMYDFSTSSCYNDDFYHEVGINLVYYWLLECKNNQEMTMLLRSWYNKQIHNNA